MMPALAIMIVATTRERKRGATIAHDIFPAGTRGNMRQRLSKRAGAFSAGAVTVIILFTASAGSRASQRPPTFNADIAPVLNRSCVACHRPGEAAPMSLLSYDQVRPWARAIAR